MNRKQKNLIIKLVTISLITLAAVLAMFDIRAWVNYSEAQKAMEQLGKIVTRYRDKHNCVPPESYVNKLKDRIEGAARLGDFHYQGRWIDFDSPKDEPLAYTRIDYPSIFVDKGFIILQLNGEVKWYNLKEGKEKVSELHPL